VEHIGES